MNNETRKRIDAVIKDIENSVAIRDKINELISEYKTIFEDTTATIEELRDEEKEKFDNMSEGLQNSERGQNIDAAREALDNALSACEAYDDIDEISFDTDEIITALDDAKGY